MNTLIHHAVYNILVQYYRATGSMFLARLNCVERLTRGFLFNGNEGNRAYLQSTFWTGRDTLAKIYNIGIGVKIVNNMPRACFDLCCRSNPCLYDMFAEIRQKVQQQHNIIMIKNNKHYYWSIILDGNYQDGIRRILEDFKPIVDVVAGRNHDDINIIGADLYQRSMKTIAPYIINA